MHSADGILIIVAVLAAAVFILTLPLKLAAKAMGAKRSGAGWCLLSLMGASFMQILGLSVPVYGSIAAFLLSSAVFAGILGTDFLRGIGVSILHVIFSAILVLIAAALFGLSFTGLFYL